MNRFLLFDSGCGTCSGVAEQIQNEADGVLTVRSIAELEIQQHLDEAMPEGWDWEPMLIEVPKDGEAALIFSGVFMRLRLIQLLGISKAWRIASMVHQSVRPLASFQKRRTFLKYSGGVLSGLAVMGLAPMQGSARQLLEFGSLTAGFTRLTGQQLQDAISEATGKTDYGRYQSHLNNDDYGEEQGQATALLVEADGYSPVLAVTIPYSHSSPEGSAEIRYIRSGAEVIITMGTHHKTGGALSRIEAYDVVNDQVVHVKTYEKRNGKIIERPLGSPSNSSEVLADFGQIQASNCDICKKVCEVLRAGSCASQASLACGLLCTMFFPAYPVCVATCFVIYVVICVMQVQEGCNSICHQWNFC